MSRSFAVLGADVKDRLSHRGKALQQLVDRLPALLANSS
jgi:inosine/xanthosine triphosphate pyrophosphatase family protein